MSSNQFELIVSEANLGDTEAADLVAQFEEYRAIAADWESKAKAIVVTDCAQKTEMTQARAGRLFLKEKRVAIEKTRKALKEGSLRKGKAIDAMAKYLTGLIQPIEEYLDKQEHFVEIRQKEEDDRRRKEVEARMEAERIEREKQEAEDRAAKEKADREERERIAAENKRLREENEAKERQIQEERAKADAEKRAIEEAARKDREAAEAKAKVEAEERERKARAEKQAIEEQARKDREAAEQREAELKAQIEEQAPAVNEAVCPNCGYCFKIG